MRSGKQAEGSQRKAAEAKEPHYYGHRDRLRRRLRRVGGEGLHDYELLELLLTYALPRKDLKPLAKELVARFGSLAGVLDAGMEELQAVPGVGPETATLICLVREIGIAHLAEGMKGRDLLSSPRAVVDFARLKLAGSPREAFMAISLNTRNEVIAFETVHEGTIDRAVVYPRRIVEAALAHHAAGLLLVHNHPSGHVEHSSEDREITDSIVQAAADVDVRVLDHIIVGRDGYLSFMEQGLMPSSTG